LPLALAALAALAAAATSCATPPGSLPVAAATTTPQPASPRVAAPAPPQAAPPRAAAPVPAAVPEAPAATAAAPAAPASPAAERGEPPRASVSASADPLRESARSYLESSLSRYRRVTAPNGAAAAALLLEGRELVALRITVRAAPAPGADATAAAASSYADSALYALVLEAAARGSTLSAALRAAGAAARVSRDRPGEAELSVECPSVAVFELSRALIAGLASPILEPEAFGLARKRLLLEELAKEGDPDSRAGAELLGAASPVAKGGREGLPPSPAKDAAALLNRITPTEASALWASVGADRLSAAAVGGADPEALAAALAAALGAWPSPRPAAQAPRPRSKVGSAAAAPLGSLRGAAMLAGAFPAPSGRGPEELNAEYGATLIAIEMLRDLLGRDLEASCGLGASASVGAPERPGEAATLAIRGIRDLPAAKAAAEAAIASIASGSCLGPGPGSPMSPIAARLGYYRARVLVGYYSGGTPRRIAARVAASVSAGGDGTDYFRAALSIAAASPEEVARAARERLAAGPASWVALGDPAIVDGARIGAAAPASP
jgi:predicted Zn-dependent peptidase